MHSKEMLALILSSVAEGVLGLDMNGKHTFVNVSAARMLGYETRELIGEPSHQTWHHTRIDGKPYDCGGCQIQAAYKDGRMHSSAEEVFWRKDGTSFPVSYASRPMYDAGRLVGAVVTFTDITEQRRLESEVKILSGLLPICCVCKKIRDDVGRWHGVADFIRKHSEADFTHGYCPTCYRQAMAELNS